MDAEETPRKPPSTATAIAFRTIDEHRCTLRALLRLVDPESPFQPILLSSIDIVSWLALFGRAAQRFGESLREIPNAKCRSAILEACGPFLRLADTMCEHAEDHAFSSADGHLGGVPDIADFFDESAMCRDDADAINKAVDRAFKVFKTSARHREALCRTLSLAAVSLKAKLEGRGGLLRLMKSRCRKSRPFRRQYATLADGLNAALAALPDPEVTPWHQCRFRFGLVHYQLEADLLSQLGAIIKEVREPKSAAATKTDTLKETTLRAVTAFLEAHGLSRSLDTGLPAVRYHTLFLDLLAPVDTVLRRYGTHEDGPSRPPRLIDEIRQLSPQVIQRDMRTSWDASLTETDPYTTEVILAALHHLERPREHSAGSTTEAGLIFGISDAELAGCLRSGAYVGADPQAEISKNRTAETKRTARTLQHLRGVGAAFHDRRQWTPTDLRNTRSTQHRLWTVNPLLAIVPHIAARLENRTSLGGTDDASKSPGSRPRPTRRNRGTRPRTKR